MGAKEVEATLLDAPLAPTGIRHVTNRIYEYMQKEIAKGHPLAPLLSKSALYSFIQQLNESGRLDVYVCRDEIIGVLGYAVGTIPWSSHKVLKELTMFTISPNFCGFGRIALERLDELAVEHDCSLIETGDALNYDPSLTENLYMKKGKFTRSYPCYYKINCAT